MKNLLQAHQMAVIGSSHQPFIAVDFDDTIVDYDGFEYNKFGEPLEGAVEAIKELKNRGYLVMLYTCRQDTPELRDYLDKNGFEFDAINSTEYNPPHSSDKPAAFRFIDDRNIKFTNWNEVLNQIPLATETNANFVVSISIPMIPIDEDIDIWRKAYDIALKTSTHEKDSDDFIKDLLKVFTGMGGLTQSINVDRNPLELEKKYSIVGYLIKNNRYDLAREVALASVEAIDSLVPEKVRESIDRANRNFISPEENPTDLSQTLFNNNLPTDAIYYRDREFGPHKDRQVFLCDKTDIGETGVFVINIKDGRIVFEKTEYPFDGFERRVKAGSIQIVNRDEVVKASMPPYFGSEHQSYRNTTPNSYTDQNQETTKNITGDTVEADFNKNCLIVNPHPQLAEMAIEIGKKYAKDHMLINDGREENPHITLLFGVDDVKEDLEHLNQSKIKVRNKPYIDYFDNPEDNNSVAIIPIESPELHGLHETLRSQLSNTQRPGKYKPHLTIAYLKLGERLPIKEVPVFEWEVDGIDISYKDEHTDTIALAAYNSELGDEPSDFSSNNVGTILNNAVQDILKIKTQIKYAGSPIVGLWFINKWPLGLHFIRVEVAKLGGLADKFTVTVSVIENATRTAWIGEETTRFVKPLFTKVRKVLREAKAFCKRKGYTIKPDGQIRINKKDEIKPKHNVKETHRLPNFVK